MITNTSSCSLLLQCPCCGSDPLLHDVVGIFECSLFVECPECGVRTGAASYYPVEWLRGRLDLDRDHVLEMVAASWNLRTPLPEPPPVRRVWRRSRYVPVYKQPRILQ